MSPDKSGARHNLMEERDTQTHRHCHEKSDYTCNIFTIMLPMIVSFVKSYS